MERVAVYVGEIGGLLITPRYARKQMNSVLLMGSFPFLTEKTKV